ncbi:MAG TPA: 4'-phosphopantetheinyl transferase superfamily protein [Vicinamibacterales bacterium]|nr:4'-phosphopantetheinyl transferase superfamily protein [Vicinamibacterales bacterium]
MMTSVVPSSEAARRCEHLLSPEERERRARFYFAIDRLEFTLTRGLIRTLLTWYLGGDPAGWRFTATDHGKPVLANGPGDRPIHFNLSHTRGIVVCALCLEPEIGIDVEPVAREVERDVADRFFAPDEVRALQTVDDIVYPSRFIAYWTAKEAYIKARGAGLSMPLDGFSIRFAARHPEIHFSDLLPDDETTWQLRQEAIGGEYMLAIALRRKGTDFPVITRWFDVDLLGASDCEATPSRSA